VRQFPELGGKLLSIDRFASGAYQNLGNLADDRIDKARPYINNLERFPAG
jgi:hypothetical protein